MIKEDIFNSKTLNIFTDASVKQFPGEFISCPGCHVCTGSDATSNVLSQPRVVLRRSTNNNGEATAVLLGVQEAIKYKNYFENINIIADSQITIFGLREWIFGWIKTGKDGVLYSSSGTPVANQEILLRIIYLILDNNLKLTFYHQRGHMRLNSMNDLMVCKKDFIKSNHLNDYFIDNELIKELIIGNSIVDNFTRNELEGVSMTPKNLILPENLLHYSYINFDSKLYKNLINKK